MKARYRFYNVTLNGDRQPTAIRPTLAELTTWIMDAIAFRYEWEVLDTLRGKRYSNEEIITILNLQPYVEHHDHQ